MDFLNKLLEQARALYGSMTPSARITTGVLVVAIAISMIYLFQFTATGGETYLYGGKEFSQADLASMQNALGQAGLTNGEIVGNRLKVPRSKKSQYISAIVKAGAQPTSASDMDDPNESMNPILTLSQQEQIAKARKQKKISSMLEEINSMESVAVEYDEVVQDRFTRKLVRSAAITAKAVGNRALTQDEIRTIFRTVKMAVGNMDESNIVVIDKNTGISHVGTADNDFTDPNKNAYAQSKVYWEKVWREKIIERLQKSYGATNVQVNVELDETLKHLEESKQLTTPVVVATETNKTTETNSRGQPAGRPGVVPNTGAANGAQAVSVTNPSQSEATRNRETSDSRVGGIITQVQKAELVPEKVSVSIGIPESYYRALWKLKNPPQNGQPAPEMTFADLETLEAIVQPQVQNVVQPLIKLPLTGEDIFEHITVTTDYDLPQESVEPPTSTQNAFSWLAANWQTLALFGLGAVGLLVFRGMVKSANGSTLDPSSDPSSLQGEGSEANEILEEAGSGRPKRKFVADGPSLKDELSELIQDDPDTAASVLQQWIGEAA